MAGTFEDILHRADRLSTTVLSPKNATDHRSLLYGADMSAQTCIDQIFRRSESLWKKKRPSDAKSTKLRSDLLLGQRSFWLDEPGGAIARKTPTTSRAVDDSLPSSSSSSLLSSSCHVGVTDSNLSGDGGAVGALELKPLETIDEALPQMMQATQALFKRDVERAFLNRCAIEEALMNSQQPIGYTSTNDDKSSGGLTPSKKPAGVSRLAATSATAVELAFAKPLSDYVTDKKTDSLARGFQEASKRSRDETISSLWEQAIALLVHPPSSSSSNSQSTLSPQALRSSNEWVNCLVERSLEYLQKHYMHHMREVVNRNLAIARVGGIPSTLSLVDGYLNVKDLQSPKHSSPCQDGFYESSGHPVWELLYNCLRCGDYEAVAEIARSRIQNLPSCAALAIALCSIAKTQKLSSEDRNRLKAEWRAEDSCRMDMYKKAVYCAFLGGDVPEICDNLENWLWLKIAPYHFSSSQSANQLASLQRTISIEYGEDYFTSNGGNATIFFQALWLTGQFERAIYVLYRSNMLVHAVHLAVLAYFNNLLITSSDTTKPILSINEKDPLECSLDYQRLVLIYVKSFECVDIQRALDYYFCLRKFQSSSGESIFNACVSRAIYLGSDMDKVIGEIDEYGIRHDGYIDKFANEINIADTIAKVAADIELSAEPIKAVRLYHAAERFNDALRVSCVCLTNALKGYRDVEESRRTSIWLAGIYKRMVLEAASAQFLTSLYLLIDLSTFFTNFAQQNYPLCLDIITKLKFIPLDLAEVSAFVSMFYTLSDEVRSLLPDICIAIMRILEQLSRTNSSWKPELIAKADAIVAYAARVPYTFPAEVTAQILEINSRLH